jgi:TolA-binding protein
MKTPGTQPAYPSLNEIEQYVQGTLPASRSREIELLAMEDPMVADALEGYTEIPAFEAVGDIQFQSSSTVGGTPWWHIGGWILGLSIGVILAVVFIPTEDKNSAEQKTVPEHQKSELNGIEKDSDIAQNPESSSNSEVTIARTPSSENERQALANYEIQQQRTSLHDFLQFEENNFDSSELSLENTYRQLKVIQLDSKLPVLLDDEKNDPALKESIIPGGTDITHFNNYKLVDYTVLRKKTWPDFSLDSLHTSPSLENEFDTGDPLRGEISQSLPYINYLEGCINAYNSGDYDQAAQQFELILKQYPTDLNAQFYGAMSHYQQGKYERAIELYNMSLKNVFKIFREDSEFYKAMSLRKTGREEESMILFLQIINNNGYYKERAIQEIRAFE